MPAAQAQTFRRVCPFCESSCGLLVQADVAQDRLISIKGDPQHPLSRGFVCAKSQGLAGLRADGDRLTHPVRRSGRGYVEIGWEEAIALAADGLRRVRAEHGPAAVAMYTGNPIAHNGGLLLALGALAASAGSPVYSSASIDCFPRFLVSILLYGNMSRCPVPDIDRTDLFMIFGGNPAVSNGSMMGAPGMPRRITDLRARGGRLIVVDPRRTETARLADEYVPIRPGADALLVLGMISTLFEEGLVRTGRLGDHIGGLDKLRALAAAYPPERVAPLTGVETGRIRALAREFANARRAVAYGRVGANCQAFGTLSIWLIDCLNILTGNLDRTGGAMFTRPVMPSLFTHAPFVNGEPAYGLIRSRRTGAASVGNALPAYALWEDLAPDYPDRFRALLTIAGNPVASNANSGRVLEALQSLDFMVSHDIYLNETTVHADVVLPSIDHLRRPECTLIYGEWMVESVVAYSPAVFERQPKAMTDWELYTALAARLAGAPDVEAFRQAYAEQVVEAARPVMSRAPADLTAAEMLERSGDHSAEEKLYDVLIRTGPFGDGYGAHPDGLTLKALMARGSAVSFGPMVEHRMPGIIETPSGRIDLAPALLLEDVNRLEEEIRAGRFDGGDFLLINRRDPRSNNSWFHNMPALVKGPARHGLLINPADARTLAVTEGDWVRVTSRVGSVEVQVKLSEDMMAGVVSLPHGWGQSQVATGLKVAAAKATANVNFLTDDQDFDRPSGNATFNGVPVRIEASRAPPAVAG